jgi:hypothetical protein
LWPKLLCLSSFTSSKPTGLINVPGCIQDAIRPESELAVTSLAREVDTLGHQQLSDSVPASGRLDQQQPKLRGSGGVLDEKHRPDTLCVDFSDPAAFALRVKIFDEVDDDLSDQCLESFVPTVLPLI